MRRRLVLLMAMALVVIQAGAAASLENRLAPPPEPGEPERSEDGSRSFPFFTHPCVEADFLWYDTDFMNTVYDQGEVDSRDGVDYPIFLLIEEAEFTSSYPDASLTPTGFSGTYTQWDTFSETVPNDGTYRLLDRSIYAVGTDGAKSFEWLLDATYTAVLERCIDDADFDLVEDTVDVCPGTVLPDDDFEAKKNRYGVDQPGGNFVDPFGRDSGISIADTYGCSGRQIADAVGGKSHKRFGPTKSMLLDWIAAKG